MPQPSEVQNIQKLIIAFGASIEAEIDRLRAVIRQEEVTSADREAKDSLAVVIEGLELLTANSNPAEIVRMNNLLDDICRNPRQSSQTLSTLAAKHQTSYLTAVALNRAMKYSTIVSELTDAKTVAIEKIAAGITKAEKPAEKVYDKTLVTPCPGAASSGNVQDAESAWTRGP